MPLEPSTPPAATIRVLLAEDHPILRQTPAEFLRMEADLKVVAEASNGWEAVELARTTRPDVILMDFGMPGLDGAEATRRIVEQQPGVRIVGFSMYEKDYIGRKMQAAGVSAYVEKGDPPDEVIRILREVAAKSR